MDNPYRPPSSDAGNPGAPRGPAPSGPARPTSATVFGIIGLIYGGLGVLVCNPIGIAGNLFTPAPQALAGNPFLQKLADPTYRYGVVALDSACLVACLMLVVASSGLLMSKGWGRSLAVIYGVVDLLLVTSLFIFTCVFLVVPLFQLSQQSKDPQVAGAMIGSAFGASMVILPGLIFPGLLLIFLTRPRVVAAYRAAAEAGDWQDEPEGWPQAN